MSTEPIFPLHVLEFDPFILVEEMQHRVVNEYASAVSSINLLARRCDKDAQSVLSQASDTLRDFAAVHHALAPPSSNGSVDLCDYLRTLCIALARVSLAETQVSLVLHDARVVLEARRAWYVGLILSELIVNVLRHGEWPLNGGVIEIEVSSDVQNIECFVSDNCGGAQRRLPGRGTYIVNALSLALGGQVRRHFDGNGTTILLTIPHNS